MSRIGPIEASTGGGGGVPDGGDTFDVLAKQSPSDQDTGWAQLSDLLGDLDLGGTGLLSDWERSAVAASPGDLLLAGYKYSAHTTVEGQEASLTVQPMGFVDGDDTVVFGQLWLFKTVNALGDDEILDGTNSLAISQVAGTAAILMNGKYVLTSPTAGATGQVLTKNSDSTGDVTWANPSALVGGNRQTASYTLAATDAGKEVEMNVASANTLTVPLNASVAIPVGFVCTVLQYGAGLTTIVEEMGGVTVNVVDGYTLDLAGRWSIVSLRKTDTNVWVATGALALDA